MLELRVGVKAGRLGLGGVVHTAGPEVRKGGVFLKSHLGVPDYLGGEGRGAGALEPRPGHGDAQVLGADQSDLQVGTAPRSSVTETWAGNRVEARGSARTLGNTVGWEWGGEGGITRGEATGLPAGGE